ncbi:MAG: iron-sulfur cluster co-chaperone HscB C-terminal domain-containing protein [Leptospirales bacterium]
MPHSFERVDPSLCWNCRESLSESDLCKSCIKIQPIGHDADFFSILGLPVRLIVDMTELTEQFHLKSRLFHPDFHQLENGKEQDISLNNAALLNQAFKTLKDPFERSLYYLDLTGPHHSPQGQKLTLPPDLLMEIMEFKEALEEQAAAQDGLGAFQTLSARIKDVESKILEGMSELDRIAGETDQSSLLSCRASLSRNLEYRKYLKSIERDLKARSSSARGQMV